MNSYDYLQVAAGNLLYAQDQEIGGGGGGTKGLDDLGDQLNDSGSDVMGFLQNAGLTIAGVMIIVVGLIGFFGSKGIGGIFKEFAKPIVITLCIVLAPTLINLVAGINLLSSGS